MPTALDWGLMSLSDSTWDKPIGGDFVLKTRGTPFCEYDALVFQYLRNDCNSCESYNEFAKAYDKLIAQGVKYFPRILGGDAPPKALIDRSNWNLNNDNAFINWHRKIPDSLSIKWNIQNCEYLSRLAEFCQQRAIYCNAVNER